MVVEEAKLHGFRQTALIYKIAPTTIVSWSKLNLDLVKGNHRGARAPGGGTRPILGSSSDEKIAEWILRQRDLHIPVSRDAIKQYALTHFGSTDQQFKASNGWLDSFFNRHNMSLRSRTSMSQKLPSDLEEKIASFSQFVRKLRVENDFEDMYIINMDETPVFFDLVPSKTIDTKGSKSVIVRTSNSDKRHVTVVLAIAADGAVLKTFVIFKGKRQLKDIRVIASTINLL